MKLTSSNNIRPEQVYAALNKTFQITITNNSIEIPDNLSPTEIQQIKNLVYPNQTDLETNLSLLPIAQQTILRKILQKLGELP